MAKICKFKNCCESYCSSSCKTQNHTLFNKSSRAKKQKLSQVDIDDQLEVLPINFDEASAVVAIEESKTVASAELFIRPDMVETESVKETRRVEMTKVVQQYVIVKPICIELYPNSNFFRRRREVYAKAFRMTPSHKNSKAQWINLTVQFQTMLIEICDRLFDVRSSLQARLDNPELTKYDKILLLHSHIQGDGYSFMSQTANESLCQRLLTALFHHHQRGLPIPEDEQFVVDAWNEYLDQPDVAPIQLLGLLGANLLTAKILMNHLGAEKDLLGLDVVTEPVSVMQYNVLYQGFHPIYLTEGGNWNNAHDWMAHQMEMEMATVRFDLFMPNNIVHSVPLVMERGFLEYISQDLKDIFEHAAIDNRQDDTDYLHFLMMSADEWDDEIAEASRILRYGNSDYNMIGAGTPAMNAFAEKCPVFKSYVGKVVTKYTTNKRKRTSNYSVTVDDLLKPVSTSILTKSLLSE
jgi:hypothetical protein